MATMKLFTGVFLFFWQIAKIVLISLAIIVPIRYFIIQPFFVRGASMQPAFESGDYLVVNEIGYRISDPKRGDVVIFRPPTNGRQFYIKRIVGLPGETVKIEDGKVWVGEDELTEKSLEEEYISGFTPGSVHAKLGKDEYFLLGDNRNASLDSRSFGPVDRRAIVGKAWIRAWPFMTFKVISRPVY